MSFNINNRLNGINPLAYQGANAVQPPNFVTDFRPPNSGDSKNFAIGTLWLDVTGYPAVLPVSGNVWMLVALVGNVATWINFASGTALQSLTGNDGLVVVGDAGDNINVLTADSTPQFKRTGANTLTVDFNLSNLALGSSLPALAGGTQNCCYGSGSGQALSSGIANSFYGYLSGSSASSTANNSGFGDGSLQNIATGSGQNTAVGSTTLFSLTAGVSNTAIGYNAGVNLTGSDSSNIFIGAGANAVAGTNNTLIIGGATGSGLNQINRAIIRGINGVNVGSVASVVSISGDQLGSTTIQGGSGVTVTPGANTIVISASGTTSLTYTSVNSAASPYTVLATDEYISVDCSGGPVTLRFPNAATIGRAYIVKDRLGSAATNNITVTTVGGAVNIDGAATFVMNTAFEAINIIGSGAAYEIY